MTTHGLLAKNVDVHKIAIMVKWGRWLDDGLVYVFCCNASNCKKKSPAYTKVALAVSVGVFCCCAVNTTIWGQCKMKVNVAPILTSRKTVLANAI